MSELGELKDALRDLIQNEVPVVMRRCVVDEVDKNEDTIEVTPLDGSPTFYNVKLKAVLDTTDSKAVIYPAKKSYVVIGLPQNDKQDAFVIQYSDFESVLIELSNDFKCELKNNGDLIFNDGNNEGLINIKDLTSEMNSRLSAMYAAITAGFNALSGLDNGASLSAFQTSWNSGVQDYQKSSYEDTKIKH